MTSAPTRPAPADPARGRELADALRRAGLSDVDDSGLARALYSSDASLYRVLPQAVVRPRHIDEIPAALEVCRSLGVPLTARGAGTSDEVGADVGPGGRGRPRPYRMGRGATLEPRSARRTCSCR